MGKVLKTTRLIYPVEQFLVIKLRETQNGFLQRVFELREEIGLNSKIENFFKSQSPSEGNKYMFGIH